jgi:hypothetical protein
MKIEEIKEEGWYWWRYDEYEAWQCVRVKRKWKNPDSPSYNKFEIKMTLWNSLQLSGEFIGPIPPPEGGIFTTKREY